MGGALLASALSNLGGADVDVKSAGINALVGHPPDQIVQRLMLERGIDISSHRARQLNRNLIYWADLILVMEKEQKSLIFSIEPSARGKVYCIGEWGEFDVPDPYRQSEKMFKIALDLIVTGVQNWVEKLKGELQK